MAPAPPRRGPTDASPPHANPRGAQAAWLAQYDAVAEASRVLAEARRPYEEGIKRTWWHVKPMDQAQLVNWVRYLEQADKQQQGEGEVLTLYERCLVPCANYPGERCARALAPLFAAPSPASLSAFAALPLFFFSVLSRGAAEATPRGSRWVGGCGRGRTHLMRPPHGHGLRESVASRRCRAVVPARRLPAGGPCLRKRNGVVLPHSQPEGGACGQPAQVCRTQRDAHLALSRSCPRLPHPHSTTPPPCRRRRAPPPPPRAPRGPGLVGAPAARAPPRHAAAGRTHPPRACTRL